jgi:hypothetical protein
VQPALLDHSTTEAAATFPPRLDSVRQARRLAMSAMSAWQLTCCSSFVGDVLLIVDELAINAVEQAGEDFEVTLILDRDRDLIVIQLRDTSPDMPFRSTRYRLEKQLGVRLVDAVSKEWGYTRDQDGVRTIWAVLER